MLIFDVETAPLPDAENYIEVGSHPANYSKPEAIAKWQAEERQKQLQRAALDPDLCRIVAIGGGDGALIAIALDEDEERVVLDEFWARAVPAYPASPNLPLVGFNCLAFDLPVLCRRSLYLGVDVPNLQRGKYRHEDVIDLADILSEQGRLRLRSLDFYCRRFGIDIPAVGDGADVPGWVAAGEWDKVEAHVRADVARTAALATRIGVV